MNTSSQNSVPIIKVFYKKRSWYSEGIAETGFVKIYFLSFPEAKSIFPWRHVSYVDLPPIINKAISCFLGISLGNSGE